MGINPALMSVRLWTLFWGLSEEGFGLLVPMRLWSKDQGSCQLTTGWTQEWWWWWWRWSSLEYSFHLGGWNQYSLDPESAPHVSPLSWLCHFDLGWCMQRLWDSRVGRLSRSGQSLQTTVGFEDINTKEVPSPVLASWCSLEPVMVLSSRWK